MLVVKFDTKLTFENRIMDVCSKASRKMYAVTRVAPYMDLSKSSVMNLFLNSVTVHWFGRVSIAQQAE